MTSEILNEDDFSDDFGFSFVSEVSNTKKAADADVVSVGAVKKMNSSFAAYNTSVNAFLDKLSANPTKDTIKWPGRGEEIKKFKEKLNKLYEERLAE